MEETSTPVETEETSAPSASETESVSEVETSEADTLDQPTEETTVAVPKSRAQERINKLAAERNYWKDAANQSSSTEETEETGEVTVQEVADKTAAAVRAEIRREEARKQMVTDAITAEEKYPQLVEDEDLAADVIALARGRGISIVAAADRVIGRQVDRTQQVDTAKGKAEQSLKSSASVPSGRKVATGEAAPVDLNSMSEADKEANWGSIVSNLANKG